MGSRFIVGSRIVGERGGCINPRPSSVKRWGSDFEGGKSPGHPSLGNGPIRAYAVLSGPRGTLFPLWGLTWGVAGRKNFGDGGTFGLGIP